LPRFSTPPVGSNPYIVKSIAPDVPMSHVLLGVSPFVIIEVIVILCVCIWPELALWLPNKMIGSQQLPDQNAFRHNHGGLLN